MTSARIVTLIPVLARSAYMAESDLQIVPYRRRESGAATDITAVPVPTSPTPSLSFSDFADGVSGCGDDAVTPKPVTTPGCLGFFQTECQVPGCKFTIMRQPSRFLGSEL